MSSTGIGIVEKKIDGTNVGIHFPNTLSCGEATIGSTIRLARIDSLPFTRSFVTTCSSGRSSRLMCLIGAKRGRLAAFNEFNRRENEHLLEDLPCDSLNIVELLMDLEDEFAEYHAAPIRTCFPVEMPNAETD